MLYKMNIAIWSFMLGSMAMKLFLQGRYPDPTEAIMSALGVFLVLTYTLTMSPK